MPDNQSSPMVRQQLGELSTKLKNMAGFYKKAVPPTMARMLTPERIAKLVMTAAATPGSRLLSCSLESVAHSVGTAVELGLEPCGPLGHCYLVPYNLKGVGLSCQLIIGYRGFVNLARRSGDILSVEAQCAYEGDVFEIELGTSPNVLHRPALRSERGEPLAVYSVAQFKNGGRHIEFMTMDEVRQNQGYLQAKRRGFGPWIDHFVEMAKKTVVRRAAKYWPLSADLAEGMSRDGEVSDETIIDSRVPLQSSTQPAHGEPDAYPEDGEDEAEEQEDGEGSEFEEVESVRQRIDRVADGMAAARGRGRPPKNGVKQGV